MKIKLLLLSCVTLLVSFIAKANNDPCKATCEATMKSDIAGGVLHHESKKPLINVNVTAYIASKKEKTAVTDTHGYYTFNDLKPGIYKLVFEKEGYKKITRDKVMIKTDDGFQLNIEMEEETDFNFVPGAFGF
jgi:hypothetical protein